MGEIDWRARAETAEAALAALRAEVSESLDLPPGIGPAPGELARLAREHREMVMRCGEAADYMTADDAKIAVARVTRPLTHPGNHKYAWTFHRRDRRHLPASKPYPKLGRAAA